MKKRWVACGGHKTCVNLCVCVQHTGRSNIGCDLLWWLGAGRSVFRTHVLRVIVVVVRPSIRPTRPLARPPTSNSAVVYDMVLHAINNTLLDKGCMAANNRQLSEENQAHEHIESGNP